MVLFAVEFYLYTYMMLWVVIVIVSYFITQLKSWDFIFTPKEHAVFEKFEGEKKCCVSAKLLLLQRLDIGG